MFYKNSFKLKILVLPIILISSLLSFSFYNNNNLEKRLTNHQYTNSLEIPENYTIESISAGSEHSAAVLNYIDDGESESTDHLYTWGSNNYGQLGLGTGGENVAHESTPQEVTDLPDGNIEQISLGDNYSMAVVNDEAGDHLYTWGRNVREGDSLSKEVHGLLGLGEGFNKDFYTTPQEVTFFNNKGNIEQISAGSNSSGVIVNDNLYTWGINEKGQLGLGLENTTNYNNPQKITDLSEGDIEQISMGYEHSAAVINNNTGTDELYTWGNNSYTYFDDGKVDVLGILGLGEGFNEDFYTTPQKITDLSNKGDIEQISMGYQGSGAIVDQKLYTWGTNSSGKLGLAESNEKNGAVLKPTKVKFETSSKVKEVSMGKYQTGAAIINNGSGDELYTWGNNSDGQLGLGYEGNPNTVNDYYDTPQKVSGLSNDNKSIAVGERFCMTSIANYDLYTWGNNKKGQLGLGNQSWPDGGFESSPQKVDFLDKNDNPNNESSSGFIWIYLLIIIIIIATISLIIGIIFKIKKNKE